MMLMPPGTVAPASRADTALSLERLHAAKPVLDAPASRDPVIFEFHEWRAEDEVRPVSWGPGGV